MAARGAGQRVWLTVAVALSAGLALLRMVVQLSSAGEDGAAWVLASFGFAALLLVPFMYWVLRGPRAIRRFKDRSEIDPLVAATRDPVLARMLLLLEFAYALGDLRGDPRPDLPADLLPQVRELDWRMLYTSRLLAAFACAVYLFCGGMLAFIVVSDVPSGSLGPVLSVAMMLTALLMPWGCWRVIQRHLSDDSRLGRRILATRALDSAARRAAIGALACEDLCDSPECAGQLTSASSGARSVD